MINKEKIQEHVRGILEALGENPDREGLVDTPKRVAKMYEEVFEGINYSNDDIVKINEYIVTSGGGLIQSKLVKSGLESYYMDVISTHGV